MINMSNPVYAGFWIRVGASILDSIILGIPVTILQLGFGYVTKSAAAGFIGIPIMLIIDAYMTGMKGGTPGKLILGLKVVNAQGGFIGIPMALLRYVGKIASAFVLCIGFLMVAFTEKKQGLHDLIAGTFVVKG